MPRRSSLYGEASANGHAVPALVQSPTRVLNEKAGYPPERLDEVIATLVDNATSGAELLRRYTPLLDTVTGELERMIDKQIDVNRAGGEEGQTLKEMAYLAVQVANILERINKMQLNSVKSKDDASRLRSFLSGDQDRDDLTHLSESQLRALVNDAAKGFVKAPEPEDVM